MMASRSSIRRARGFTLIELMIVIVILGFTAAVAAMSLRSSRGEKAPAFARTLLNGHNRTNGHVHAPEKTK